MISVAIAGLGRIALTHLKAWSRMPDVRVIAACNATVAPPVDGITLYPSLEALLGKERPDIVDICAPTYLHRTLAEQTMQRGIHVICEKPIALTARDAEAMFAAAAKHGVQFMVAQVLRFWPEYASLESALQGRLLGAPLGLSMWRLSEVARTSWDNWMQSDPRSGMTPYDLHIHDLDFIVHTLGVPGHADVCRTRPATGPNFPDHLRARYDCGGLTVTAESALFDAQYPFSAGFRAHFEQGVLEYTGGTLTLYQPNAKRVFDLAAQREFFGIDLPDSNGYYNELRYFADAVSAGTPTDKVSPEELLNVLNFLEKTYPIEEDRA